MNEFSKFWDKKAEAYAKSPISDEDSYRRKLAETQAILTSNMRILEFGCGTGTTAIHHAPHVLHVDAIDSSGNMVEIGRRKARESNIDNVTFTQSTLEGFNAESASLDVVLGLNVIHLISDRQSLFTEVGRILKPGGFFVSSTVCLANSYLRFIQYLLPLGKLLGQMPDVFVLAESELVAEITAAGFTIETQWHHGKSGIAVFVIARKT